MMRAKGKGSVKIAWMRCDAQAHLNLVLITEANVRISVSVTMPFRVCFHLLHLL